ncbi:patatin-like phospholipase-domain-containing protein [Diplogelasinospora grovesii]|uniref:Patatin-like phospholipase-domain-containing protein n=1 Tax=Diplogelasinospora grovesii TaxID=303347 RepID=A0AAN6S5X4_9PEZI|nr:patatin-like phospholipase-domain-containing protein [Diplogelasinospora grovesii]
MSAEIERRREDGPPQLPRSVSALRSSTSKPRRVPTRVSIAVPEPSTRNESATRSSTSASSPDLSVTSTPWAKRLILTLDGGGIRGYSSLIILRALMEEIARIEQTLEPFASSSAHTDRIPEEAIPAEVLRKGKYLPCHYFDYIAGTSVGGLIAIMLGMLSMPVEECITEFQRQNKAIPLTDDLPGVNVLEFQLLNRRTTWPTKKTRSFYDTFAKFAATATARGRSTSAPSSSASAASPDPAATEFKKDTLQCQTLAWCTEVEEHSERRPYAFCTYKEDEDESDQKLVSIPEVAKAITTPSSSSFKPFKLGSGQFVDGSQQIRDPTLEVLKEITTLLDPPGEPVIDLLLSLGTDEHHAWFYQKLRRPGVDNEHHWSSAEDVAKEKGRSYLHYYRFEVTDIKLGFRKKYVLKEIEEATEKWLKTDHQRESIHKYAEMLVERRRARASTIRWETFALGVRYHCFHDDCLAHKDNESFDSRGSFYDHLDAIHCLSRKAAKRGLNIEEELDRGRKFGCS